MTVAPHARWCLAEGTSISTARPRAAIAAKDGLFARIAREMRRAFDEADPDGGASAQPGE
jgi:hypothetical protein